MLELDPLKVAFKFMNLSAVSIHRVLDTVPLLVDLLDNDLGIAKRQISLDAKGNCYAEPVDQGFVLCTIVGGLVVDL
jgi:hypothetical protein